MTKVESLESENKKKFETIERLEKKNEDNQKDIKHLQEKIDKLDKSNRENEIKNYDSKLQNLSNDWTQIRNELAQSNEKYDSLGINFLIMLIIFHNNTNFFYL